MEEFIEKMADILDVDKKEIDMNTRFRDTENWGSMAGYSILIVIEEDYNVKISVDDFMKLNTIGDLFNRLP